MNFNYPLEYSYYFEPKEIKKIKRGAGLVFDTLSNYGFARVSLPFLVSPSLVNPTLDHYRSGNLIKAFPGGNRSKHAYLSPYMLFTQAIPLIRLPMQSYKNFPLSLFTLGPSYKRLHKSSKNPFMQTEEIFSVQGGIFFLEEPSSIKEQNNTLDSALSEIMNSFESKYKKISAKMFYKSESVIFKNKDETFLAGYHFLPYEYLSGFDLKVKNSKNRFVGINLISFSISQNLFLL